MNFVHLHNHTHYSLLDGLTKIDEMVEFAKEQGSPAVAITDHGVMYGAIEFYQKCLKEEIKPIIGVETYVAPKSRFDKSSKEDKANYHLLLLAKNNEGYQNMMKLITLSHLEGFYYKPRVDWEILQKYSKGIIACTACIGGEIPQLIIAGKEDAAKRRIKEYNDLFGRDNFYLEIQPHPNLDHQNEVNAKLIEYSKELNVPLVASNDIHYLKKEDAEVQDILLCLQNKKKKEDKDRMCMLDEDFSMKTNKEMIEYFKDVPEAIENTVKIAEKCNVEIELGKIQLPYFEVPEGYDGSSYLRKLCGDGLVKRYGKSYDEVDKEIKERMDYELSIIDNMGWPSYFLIVADFVVWAKQQKIVVGPGRGSAAGSFVSYLLGITNIDPLKYDLLFERFLNPERVSMPDIDLDFADTRRDEVIKYVEDKYGKDNVAQIITFGTMAARAAVRDVGRVLDYSYDFCDKLAKMIPMFSKTAEALENVEELKDFYQKDEGAKKILDYTQRIEGVSRHASTHACGVLITKDPLVNYTPLQYASSSDRSIVSQYSLHPTEDLGLLKMDFLGLKNLTIIESAINIIKNTAGDEIDIDQIPLEDEGTYKLFQEGETTGVFQFESSGMKRYLRELKPSEFEDVVAMVALYRPGPMEWIPDYVKGKHGKKKITYLHKDLKPILDKTYGVAIYQEQVMQIARTLAGFSMGEADVLRKAMGKKIPELLAKQKENFINGCVKNGINKELAEKIFSFIEPFAGYGFNRCLTGDTVVNCAKTGKPYTMKQLYSLWKEGKKLPTILSLNEQNKLIKKEISAVYNNGEKKIYKIKTRLGKTIKATANHPFKTINGWINLEDLKTGNFIGLSRKASTSNKAYNIEDYKLAVLGYLIAEGNLCHTNGFYFYSGGKEELNDYKKQLEMFKNTKGTLNSSKSAVSIYAGRVNLNKKSEAVEWVKNIGLYGQKAIDKKLPDFVFELNKEQTSLLLSKMFQGDGCINLKRKYPQIFYATSSKVLAKQLQHLFLKLNIITTLHTKKFKYREGYKKGYTITINRYNNIKEFYDNCSKHLIGEKKRVFEEIIKKHAIINSKTGEGAARGSKDIIPGVVRERIVKKINKQGYTLKGFARKFNFSERLLFNDKKKKGYLRETVNKLSRILNDKELFDISNSDIYWDEIIKIESVGKEITYDLTIDKTHNFVANDFIVHNSHAACYALIGYQTAYLKAHWPAEFMAALLTADQQNIDRVAVEIEECRNMGMEVMPPDINESMDSFTVTEPAGDGKSGIIRFGLNGIKNVGEHIVEVIIKERKKNGHYKDVFDFLERVTDKDMNKKSLESLIKSGSFDRLEDRSKLLNNMDALLNFNKEASKIKNSKQSSLFGNTMGVDYPNRITLEDSVGVTRQEKLNWEKELLGLYITEHPFRDFKKHLQDLILPINDISSSQTNQNINVAGIVSTVKKIVTRNSKSMVFAKIEDERSSTEVLVFPNLLQETSEVWEEGKPVICQGKVSDKDQEIKILADTACNLDLDNISESIKNFKSKAKNGFNAQKFKPKKAPVNPLKLIFKRPPGQDDLNELKNILVTNSGENKVYFKINHNGDNKYIESGFRVDNNNEELSQKIKDKFGDFIEIA